ncbi:cardiolipin synthase [Rhizobiales bacterium]|uniref:cardiolipin synthase n=1 Tax=Hongsoonwoonella zoysiae TaxID=2821844 RepID=UPI001560A76A|nr:cardiolipin synthase [Hongsoonwoonella zoysiae]NRG19063.1 cardiolipin synthase [Hongsoonwoonella zoysiae]
MEGAVEHDVRIVDLILTNLHIIALATLVLYTLSAVCAVREVLHSRTSQGSIAWLLSLIFLPFPTAFLYLVFGWKRFDDYVDVRTHAGRETRTKRAEELGLSDRQATAAWPVLSRVAQLPFLAGNSVDVLIDGEATFASILDGIDRAEEFILFQFFIVHDDNIGRKVANALIERAKAGVEVLFLYDEIGSKSLPKSYLARLSDAGIKVSGFNKRHKILRMTGPMRLNYRNHRKIVVVDGKCAWVGGHNVGDEYLGHDPSFGHWRDTHVRVEGPSAFSCALVFAEDWHWATGKPLGMLSPGNVPEKTGNEPVLVMPTGPADALEDCAIAFTEAISRARKRLWIVSPYFVPGMDVLTSLYAAAMRGVDVRILLPKKADHWLVWLASYAHADDLVDHGIRIYRYNKGFLHQKVMLVDDEIASVGTVNFDNRSFRINFEITLWFTGDTTISAIEKMLEADFKGSIEEPRNVLSTRSYAFRFAAQAARLFSPIL